MSRSILRRAVAAVSSLAVAAMVAFIIPTPAEAAASRAYGGSSYGISAKFGDLVSVGRTANQPLCTTASNVTRTNHTGALTLGAAGTVGDQTTKVQSVKSGTTQSSITTSTTNGLNLLGGLITADAVVAKATVTLNSGGYSQKGETTFTNLTIDGEARSKKPAPNTTINLPLNRGKVILNQQGTLNQFGLHSQGVNGLRLILNPGFPGVPAGGMVASYALASLHSPTFKRAFGTAYATKVQGSSVAGSGASAAVTLPCGGSAGVTRTNNLVGGNVPGALSLGTADTTAKSTDSAAGTTATTSARITDISLLGGVVTADTIKAVSSTTKKGSTLSRSSAGTSIVDLRINGTPVAVDGPNTTRTIPGVGTLYLRRSIWDKDGLQVIAIQLVLSQAQGGLAAGSVITAGYAQSGVV